MRWKLAFIACLSFIALSTSAQVHRCKDSTGKSTYSDRPCESGQIGQLIERQKTREEIYRERVQAHDAESRKQQRYMAEMERERQAQWQRAATAAPYPAQPQPKGFAERLAERNAGVASTIQRRNTPPPQDDDVDEAASPTPGRVKSCSEFGCKDTNGQIYKRSVVEGVFKGPDGNCRMVGNSMRC